MMMLLVLTPFTYSGGGGPVGNRYFLSFYPLFLLLTPALAGVRSAAVALAIGALFTAKILLNPFYSSFHPGEHLKSGAQRWLPLELTLLLDLPMAADRDRSNRRLGGTPPVHRVFPGRQRLQPRRRHVLGEREVARGNHSSRACRRCGERPVRDESDSTAARRDLQRGHAEPRHGFDGARIAHARDEG